MGRLQSCGVPRRYCAEEAPRLTELARTARTAGSLQTNAVMRRIVL